MVTVWVAVISVDDEVDMTCGCRVLKLDASLERNEVGSNCTVSLRTRLRGRGLLLVERSSTSRGQRRLTLNEWEVTESVLMRSEKVTLNEWREAKTLDLSGW